MMLALAAGLMWQAAQDPAKLSLDAPACRIEVLAGKIAAAGKTHLDIAQNLKGEVLTIRVNDVTLPDLLDRIAKTLYAHWRPTESGYFLEQTPELKAAEARSDNQAKLAMIKEILAKKAKQTGDSSPLTPAEVKEEIQERDKLMEQAKKQASGEEESAPPPNRDTYRHLRELTRRAPLARLMSRLVLSIDPQMLMRIEPYSRLVFATNPTRMQTAMPWANPMVADFLREQNMLADTAASVRKADSAQTEAEDEDWQIGMGVSSSPARNISKILFCVSRDDSFMAGTFRFELKVVGKDGSILFQTQENLRANDSALFADMEPKPEPGDTPLTLSDDDTEFLKSLKEATESHENGNQIPKILRDRLSKPFEKDPLSVICSDILAGTYPGKNFVARMPDEWVLYGFSLAFLPSLTVGGTQKLVHSFAIFSDESDGNWEVLMPAQSLQARHDRVDRRKLETYLERAAKGFDSLDDYADAIYRLPSPTQNPMMMIMSMIDPVPGFSIFGENGMVNWDALQFFGSLPTPARQALRRGTPFAFGLLPQESKLALARVVYDQPEMITPSADLTPEAMNGDVPSGSEPIAIPGWAEIMAEPTESIPAGVMPETVVTGRSKYESVAQIDDPSGHGYSPITADDLGSMIAQEFGQEGGIDPATTKLRPGVKETISLTFQFGPVAFGHEELTWSSMSKTSQLLAAFSPEFRKAVEEARKRAKEQPADGPDDGGPPIRKVPPPVSR